VIAPAADRPPQVRAGGPNFESKEIIVHPGARQYW
jgi:hypothetical protein